MKLKHAIAKMDEEYKNGVDCVFILIKDPNDDSDIILEICAEGASAAVYWKYAKSTRFGEKMWCPLTNLSIRGMELNHDEERREVVKKAYEKLIRYAMEDEIAKV